jgi:SPP1 gp7 family putative phage head morphogenesis protein
MQNSHNTIKLFGWDTGIRSPFAKASTPVKQPLKTDSRESDVSIINYLVNEFKDRSKKDIQDWVSALQQAEHHETPRWKLLQNIYDYLSPDGHLGSQVRLRKFTTRSSRFYIKDGITGKEDVEKTKLFRTLWCYHLIGEIIESVLRGYSAVQLIEHTDPDNKERILVSKIPRAYLVPQRDMMLAETNGEVGYSLYDPAWEQSIIWVKSEETFGIMNEIVRQLIYKKNAEILWAAFSERFGIPLITLKTRTRDQRELDRLEMLVSKLGEAAQAVMPFDSDITIYSEASKGDPYKIFDARIQRCNDEISKSLVGGTMVSDSGSSLSQSEVHERTLKTVGRSDMILVEFVMNNQVLPVLINKYGYPLSPDDTFVFDTKEDLPLTEQWKIINEALQHYDIPDDYVSNTFSFPITGRKQGGSVNFNTATGIKALAPVAADGITLPSYKGQGCCVMHQPFASGGYWEKILDELSKKIVRKIWDGNDPGADVLNRILVTGKALTDALNESWSRDISYDSPDLYALHSMEMNLYHFSSLREQSLVGVINQMLLDKEKLNIRTFEEFEAVAQPLLDNYNRNWLRTEYNFAVATGQMSSRWFELKENKDIYSRWIYRTVGDDLVRVKHADLDGKVFLIEDENAAAIWPPNDWNCRCEGQSDTEENNDVSSGAKELHNMQWTEKQLRMFGFNRAEAGKVFTADQMYMKDTGLAGSIRKMTYDIWGLKTHDDLKGNLPKITVDKNITEKKASQYYKAESGKDYMGFEDYLKRKLKLTRATFDMATTSKRGQQLAAHFADVIESPDEVYMSDYSKDAFTIKYIKHYGDTVLVVPARLSKSGLEIDNWYEMADEKNARSGILIHQ